MPHIAAEDCQEQLSATPRRCASLWRPLARLNSPSVTEAGSAHAPGWIDRQCVVLGCRRSLRVVSTGLASPSVDGHAPASGHGPRRTHSASGAAARTECRPGHYARVSAGPLAGAHSGSGSRDSDGLVSWRVVRMPPRTANCPTHQGLLSPSATHRSPYPHRPRRRSALVGSPFVGGCDGFGEGSVEPGVDERVGVLGIGPDLVDDDEFAVGDDPDQLPSVA